MSLTLILACLWVLAATVTAMLPMRRQAFPGLPLLIAAPVLIGLIWHDHGWIAGSLAALAFASMFRNPLRYLWSRLTGGPKWTPGEDV